MDVLSLNITELALNNVAVFLSLLMWMRLCICYMLSAKTLMIQAERIFLGSEDILVGPHIFKGLLDGK